MCFHSYNVLLFPCRVVFGYEGKSNDLKVVETGGMSRTWCILFVSLSTILRKYPNLKSSTHRHVRTFTLG